VPQDPRGTGRLADNAVTQAEVARAKAKLGARAYLIDTPSPSRSNPATPITKPSASSSSAIHPRCFCKVRRLSLTEMTGFVRIAFSSAVGIRPRAVRLALLIALSGTGVPCESRRTRATRRCNSQGVFHQPNVTELSYYLIIPGEGCLHPGTENMPDAAFHAQAMTGGGPVRPSLDRGFDPRTAIVFLLLLGAGLLFVAYSLYSDVAESGAKTTTFLPYLLLFVALLTALGFEFVNGFHDTANAVATVIYTHAMPAQFAVVWSGSFNFLGVLLSSGAVAFGIISLLPVELILQVGSSAGFAMVFALLIAAMIWNLGTWYLGLPASSSHTLIGSIIGVGIANALARGQDGTSGVDWGQATAVGKALLFSPIVGFVASALLLLVMKALIRRPELYRAPETDKPPAWWIRGLLIPARGSASPTARTTAKRAWG
jgi:hypothetical protein